ncbi:beta-propeller domain-containing protein [Aliikangiella coralliicola]|uniref:Beta-propeller domain-containing protein n=1 Tax=Aliikangiella coralliicola TaxID=2592383 RepID=A0A545UBR3_9GAMM|nr:beta-propeller domain-containing protein [Aliikangiella coralliicola]TQV86897.1 hypothetical protein FLL46_13855 [Aliikangiella coralliicola]
MMESIRKLKRNNSIARHFQIILVPLLATSMLACSFSSSDEETINIDYSKISLAGIKNKPLQSVSSNAFTQYLKNGIRQRLGGSGSVLALAETADAGQIQSQFSTTNVHELGVDEDDRLKFDGTHLFLVEDRYFPTTHNSSEPVIRVMRTTTENALAEEVATIENSESDIDVTGIYLHPQGNAQYLVSLSATRYFEWFSILIDSDWNWTSGKTVVNLHNVTDQSDPQFEWKIEIEGNLEGSRKVGNKLYLVNRYVPQVDGLNMSAQTEAERIANERLIIKTPVSDLLPHYQVNDGGIRSLVTAEDCFVAGDLQPNEGYADVITLTSINLDSRSIESSVCLNANVQGIYSSTDNFYIGASGSVSWVVDNSGTSIHKFALEPNGVQYKASGFVEGSLGWSEPSFRMSEYQDNLRVVTSQWSDGQRVHQLFVMSESTGNLLESIATLPNSASPEPIGKPGEDIFAVRFVEDKAYIVTFEQIDPLYEIDLSDPQTPFISAELEMPGFSRYLHPVADGWLIGIGHQVENNLVGGIKIELYDIRNPQAPAVKNSIVLGGRNSWTEATQNLKSISLLQLDDDRQQIAFPANRYEKNEASNQIEWVDSGLFVFELSGLENNELDLSLSGEMITEINGSTSYPVHWGVGRSLIHSDAIYYFQGNQLWSGMQTDISQVLGPF